MNFRRTKFIQYMNQSQYQIHRLAITIQKAYISVRFPCSISFQLKLPKTAINPEAKIIESGVLYQLLNGTAEANETIQSNIDIEMITEQYYDMKIAINVILTSPNGKVPAGSVSIPIVENGKLLQCERVQSKQIQKCADNSAKLEYSLKIEYIETKKKLRQEQSQTSVSRVKLKNKIPHSISEFQLLSKDSERKRAKEILNTVKNVTYSNIVKKGQLRNSHLRMKTERDLIINDIEDKMGLKQGKDSEKESKQLMKIDNSPMEGQNYPIFSPPEVDRSESSVSNKGSRSRVNTQFMLGKPDQQLKKFQLEIKDLSQQLKFTKQRNKILQRNEKQLVSQVRYYKDQLQKMRIRTSNTEGFNVQYKQLVQEKEKVITKINDEMKILKDQLDDTKALLIAQEKKLEHRQSINKEQIRKLRQKYQISEGQRQKLVSQINNKLNEYEMSQKRNQQSQKQKERQFQEEKNKFLKKIQALQIQLRNLNEKLEEKKEKIEEQTGINIKITKSNELQKVQLEEALKKVERLDHERKVLMEKNAELDDMITGLVQQNANFGQIEKKYKQVLNKNESLLQNQARLILKCESSCKTIKELENQIKQLSSMKQAGNSKISQLQKELNVYKKKNESLQAIIEQQKDQIQMQKEESIHKQAGLTNQLAIKDEIIKKLENSLAYVSKNEQRYQNECQNLKFQMQQDESTINIYKMKINELNNEILGIKQQLLNQQQINSSCKRQLSTLQVDNNGLKQQIHNKEIKQKEQYFTIKSLKQTETELNKKIGELSLQLDICKQKCDQLDEEINQEREYSVNLKKILEASTDEFSAFKISSIKNQEDLKRRIGELEREVARSLEQGTYYKQKCAEVQKNLISLQNELMQSKKKIKSLEIEDENNKEKINRQQAKLKKAESEWESDKKKYEKQRDELLICLQKFANDFCQVPKGPGQNKKGEHLKTSIEISQQIRGYNVTQQSVHIVLSKLLKFKDKLLEQLRVKQIGYKDQISDLQAELQAKKQTLLKQQELYEQNLREEKKNFKQYVSQSLLEKNTLMDKIVDLQQRIHQMQSQRQKTLIQLGKVKAQLQDLKVVHEQIKQQQRKLEQELNSLALQKKELEGQLDKLMSAKQANIRGLYQEKSKLEQKYKSIIKQLQRRSQKLQDRLKQEQMKLQQIVEQSLKKDFEIEKVRIKIQEQSIENEQNGQKIRILQQTLKNSEQKQKEKLSKIQLLEQENENKAKVITEYKRRQKILEDKSAQQQQDYRILQEELRVTNQLNEQNERILKASIDQLKSSIAEKIMQIKEQEQKIIKLQSDIDLQKFYNKQMQEANEEYKLKLATVQQELMNKKAKILQLNKHISEVKNSNLQLKQVCDNLRNDKASLELEVVSLKEQIQVLDKIISENSMVKTHLEIQKKEREKIRAEYSAICVKYEVLLEESKVSLAQNKKDLAARSLKQQELKSKISQMQSNLQLTESQRKKQTNQLQKKLRNTQAEYEKTSEKLKLAEKELSKIKNLYQKTKANSSRQIQNLSLECGELTKLLTQKQEILCVKEQLNKEQENKLKCLANEWNKSLSITNSKNIQKTINDQNQRGLVGRQVQSRSKALLKLLQRPLVETQVQE